MSDTTIAKTIPWGSGALKVLNNLNGILIGVSALAAEVSDAAQDQDKILIKVWDGGSEPVVIKEITATRLTSTGPSVAINQKVNFIQNNRLYFSINVVNGHANKNYYGLWSVGKNKFGRWTVTLERQATNDGSETGVLAAAMYGDFLTCVHTSAGTITNTVNGDTLSNIYTATSVHESTINPEMPDVDRPRKKRLKSIFATYLPLPTDGQVVLKYRVDVLPSATGTTLGNGWTTIFTEATDAQVKTKMVLDAAGSEFTEGYNYEFRLESTGGAIIVDYGYEYDVIND